jgi:hypothetical protein
MPKKVINLGVEISVKHAFSNNAKKQSVKKTIEIVTKKSQNL